MDHNMKKVLPYHVIIGNRQFIGMAKEFTEFVPYITIKDTVNVTYHSPAPGVINRTMTAIESDNDYHGDELPIFLGPGVILFKINEMGDLFKQYLAAKSGLVMPNLVVNGIRQN